MSFLRSIDLDTNGSFVTFVLTHQFQLSLAPITSHDLPWLRMINQHELSTRCLNEREKDPPIIMLTKQSLSGQAEYVLGEHNKTLSSCK
jgi:hypothetical protein